MNITVPRIGTVFTLTKPWIAVANRFDYQLGPGRVKIYNPGNMRLYKPGAQFRVERIVIKKGCYTDFLKLRNLGKNVPKKEHTIEVPVQFFLNPISADVDMSTIRIDEQNPAQRKALILLVNGDVITLEEDWLFDLWFERRNRGMLDYCGNYPAGYNPGQNDKVKACIMAGSQLLVDRVYIRKESNPDKPGWALNKGGEYNSITFKLQTPAEEMYLIDALTSSKYALTHGKGGRKKHPRFWAKLRQVNTIVGSVEKTGSPPLWKKILEEY